MKQITIILIALLTITACDKNDDDSTQDPTSQLPPATMTGENTFGCLINNEPFIVTRASDQVAIFQQGQLQFGGSLDNNNTDISISIILTNPQINTIYDLSNFPIHAAEYRERANGNNCGYQFEDTYQGTITFSKIDEINYVISGIFNFSITNQNCGNVEITQGRFDLQYIP